ncbi:MAG: hypothetical protein ACI841_000524 [Planctomycetota bacterium]
MTLLRRCLLFLVSLGVFLVAARGIALFVPWPADFGPRAKWEWLQENIDDYDVIFVGSSATYYGIVPELFDQVMEERGHTVRSFNFGCGGMTEVEAGYVLDQLLSLEPEKLKHVFIEASGWDLQIPDDKNAYTPRRLHWHDAKHTLGALKGLPTVAKPMPREDGTPREDWRMRSAQLHGELFMRKLTAEGQGPRIALALLGREKEVLEPTREQLAVDHGFIDLSKIEGEKWEKASAKFHAKLAQYKQTVGGIHRGNKAQLKLENFPGMQRTLAQIDEVRATGAEPIYYTAPRATALPWAYRLAESGTYPLFFGYNRPGKYPELYLPENHFDSNHLKRSGADAFTRLIATDFANTLDERKDD